MHTFKRLAAIVLSTLLIASLTFGTNSSASGFNEQEAQAREAAIQNAQEELRAKQEANRKQLQQTQEEMASFRAQSNSIQAQLDLLFEQNIASTEEYERLSRELQVAEDEMNKAIDRYEIAQENAENKQVEYETRIVTLFRYRSKSVFELLLTSDSIGGFFTNMRLMDYISSSDNLMLEELMTAQEDADVAREEADEMVLQAEAYYQYAEEQLILLRNDIELTEINLDSVEAELLNRSSLTANLENEYNEMDADLAAFYAELQAIDNARATQAAIDASIAESIRVSESIRASEAVAESIRVSQSESAAREAYLEASREAQRQSDAEAARIAESIRVSESVKASILASQQAAQTTAAPTPKPTTPTVTTPSVSSNYMMWPVAGNQNVSSHYGPRVHPITGNTSAFHYGTDFSAPFGTPVRATLDGTVVIANKTWQGQNYTSHKSGHGNYVTVQHANGLTSTYAHLKYVAVSVGQTVKQGEYLGQVGSTGASTGAHLHFEVAQYGNTFNAWSSNWLLNPNSIR